MTYFIHRAAYVDVLSGTTEVQDVLVRDGMVEAMGPTLVCPEDAQVIRAEAEHHLPSLPREKVHPLESAQGLLIHRRRADDVPDVQLYDFIPGH